MFDPKAITHLTFDCYGTLIDWERGILAALQPMLESHGVNAAPATILQLYVRHEARLEAQEWRSYGEILNEVGSAVAQELGIALSTGERDRLPSSVGKWMPFPDTVPALRRLKQRFRLVILSNVDDALFAETAKHLEVAFDAIITAEQVGSYKPNEAHFREALRRLNAPATQILHVAQSLYHDHVPARRLGFRTVWIKRRSLLGEMGLAPPVALKSDLEVADLELLADGLLTHGKET